MGNKLKSNKDFKQKTRDYNCVWLLTQIKAILLHFNSNKYRILAINNTLCQIINMRLGPHKANNSFQERFLNAIKVYEHYGGNIGENEVTKNVVKDMKTPPTT